MTNVDEMAFDCRGDCHGWRHKVRSAAGSLASFEISIAGRGTAFSGLKHVGIHRQTHTAAGFPPLEPCVFEQAVEPFLFGLLFHQTGSRHHHRPHSRGDTLAFGEVGRQTEVFDA